MTKTFQEKWNGIEILLIHGDSKDAFGSLGRHAPDAIVSDPPYGIDYNTHYGKGRKMPDGSVSKAPIQPKVHGDKEEFNPAHLLDHEHVVLWGANHFAKHIPSPGRWLVWDKRCGVIPERAQADCEMAWSKKPGPARLIRHMWDGMVKDSEHGEPRIHPTQKPVKVMTWCMEKAEIPEGAVVCDPYMGSASTGIACIRSGRSFVGLEIVEEYFDAAVERVKAELNGRLL